MTRVTIEEAEGNLTRLIEEVEKGGEVFISRQDKAVVRLIEGETERPKPNPERRPGRMKGLIDIGSEFFEPLPEEELRAWEGLDDWDITKDFPRR